MPPFLGSLLTGGISLLGNLFANKKRKDESELAYERMLDMWNKQNEYNHPAQQMARLSEAGLNPNLVYGSGNVANTTSTSSPKYQPTHYDPYTLGGDIGAMNQIAAQNQTAQTEANIREANARIEKTNQEKLDIEEKRQQNQTDLLIKQQKYMEIQYRNAKTETERAYWKSMLDANLEKIKSETALNIASKGVKESEMPLNWARTDLTSAQTETEKKRPALIEAQTGQAESQTSLNYANADYIANALSPKTIAETEKIAYETGLAKIMAPSTIMKLNAEVALLLAQYHGTVTRTQLEQITRRQMAYNTDSEFKLGFNYVLQIVSILGGTLNNIAGGAAALKGK